MSASEENRFCFCWDFRTRWEYSVSYPNANSSYLKQMSVTGSLDFSSHVDYAADIHTWNTLHINICKICIPWHKFALQACNSFRCGYHLFKVHAFFDGWEQLIKTFRLNITAKYLSFPPANALSFKTFLQNRILLRQHITIMCHNWLATKEQTVTILEFSMYLRGGKLISQIPREHLVTKAGGPTQRPRFDIYSYMCGYRLFMDWYLHALCNTDRVTFLSSCLLLPAGI